MADDCRSPAAAIKPENGPELQNVKKKLHRSNLSNQILPQEKARKSRQV